MFNWQSSKILITGATGFIGSHLTESILKRKPKLVVCFYQDNNPKSYFNYKNLFEKAIVIKENVKDFNQILKTLIKYDIDIIFHLAAQPIVEIAYKLPLETINTNIMGTANILEAARIKGDLKAIIIASSDKAYGKSKILPYKEEQPLKGDHPYEVSKSAADLIAQTYHKTYGLPISITRFGNVFGPGDLNFNRLIPGVFEAIVKKKEFLIRSDGKMIRDYVYVKDVVDGYIRLIEEINKIKGEAFNFGGGNIFSVIEIVKKIKKTLNTKLNYKILNLAKNEISEQYLDWTKAEKLLNWKPKFNFSEAIKKSFVWYKNFYFR